jgi:hypothetical protein
MPAPADDRPRLTRGGHEAIKTSKLMKIAAHYVRGLTAYNPLFAIIKPGYVPTSVECV